MPATKITFRKFPVDETGAAEVIAFFPEEKWDNRGNISSYVRIGQHGGASRFLLDELEEATANEYAALKTELESIGYKLEII